MAQPIPIYFSNQTEYATPPDYNVVPIDTMNEEPIQEPAQLPWSVGLLVFVIFIILLSLFALSVNYFNKY